MRFLAALVFPALLLSSGAASAAPSVDRAAAPEVDDEVVLVQEGGELGFFDKYFPLSLDITHPSVEDNKVGLWIGTILPFGFLWSPFVFGDERPGDDFIVDAIIIALVHLAPLLLYLAFPIAIIPIIGWLIWAAIVIGVAIYAWVNLLYLTPVAIINAYDRSLGVGGDSGRKREPRRRYRRRRRRDAALEVPAAPALVSTPSESQAFAY